MKRRELSFTIYISCILVLASCDEHDISRKKIEWKKIEFPNESAVYSVFGDLEEYLLVATSSKILRTDDGGLTWDTVQHVAAPIGEFQPLNDNIYAVSNSKDYVSHDRGQTWEETDFDHEVSARWEHFEDTNGKLYRVVQHYNGELALPTTLLQSVNKGNSWEVIFPHEHVVYCWHLDQQNRVYLGTTGDLWGGQFFKDDIQNKAVLFYTE
jgi:photosystem II stability/assembly factor-like uncharacterized protein